MVVVGHGDAGVAAVRAAAARGLPVHRARLVPDPIIAARLAGQRVVAFAGIGRPEKFAGTLHDLGATIERLITYGDHHMLTEAEAERLLREAGHFDLVTTAKDFARLAGRHAPAYSALMRRAMIVPVTLLFDDPAAMAELIEQARAATRSGATPA